VRIALTVALCLPVATAAMAQQRPSIAVLPAQYYSSDAGSAANLTQALASRFETQGYRVAPVDRIEQAATAGGYDPKRHYSDEQVVAIGRRLGVDLVAYPRVLGVGYAATDPKAPDTGRWSTILHLRVLNTGTNKLVYFRQISHEFQGERPESVALVMPPSVATAAAGEVTTIYFERVAGSREELGRAQ
jgi:hypothetical protein